MTKNIKLIASLALALLLIKGVKADLGYEYLDNNKVLHFWNDIDNYYLNTTSGIQLTNHYQEYWTHNYFCLAYKNVFGNWQSFCNDVLPFDEKIISDNSTYINITYGRRITTPVNSLHANLTYSLKKSDLNLTLHLRVKNIGIFDFDRPTSFVWDIRDIKIGNDYVNDAIKINNTQLNLASQTGYFNSVDGKSYRIFDNVTGKYLVIDWKNNNYNVSIYNNPEYNNPVSLSSAIGIIPSGEEKSLIYHWIDAGEQFARPSSDISTGTWTVTPLFAKIDEVTASDADFVTSLISPIADTFEVHLSNPIDPTTSSGHIMRLRYKKTASSQIIDITWRLMEGATTIHEENFFDIGTGFITSSYTLSALEADSIFNYDDLRYIVIADNGGIDVTPPFASAVVSWAELELPQPRGKAVLRIRKDGLLMIRKDGLLVMR